MSERPTRQAPPRTVNRRRVLGIDASNIRGGGGLTHLSQLLRAAEPQESGFDRVVVWGGRATLAKLPEANGLVKAHERLLDGPTAARLAWREAWLPRRARAAAVHVLFAPGGTLPHKMPCSTVAMSQNLLPFDHREAARFGLSTRRWRYTLLRRTQLRSFAGADGLIFLTEHARCVVGGQLGAPLPPTAIIPHGVEPRFRLPPRQQEPLEHFSADRPLRLLYVSIVNHYKHQWHVAEAVGRLRAQGMPVAIDFVGPAFGPALSRLRAAIRECDPEGRHIRYLGPAPHARLHEVYHAADGFVFASTCENLPIILLEAMAAGLPIACSSRQPMVGILGDGGVYFDPERPDEIAEVLRGFLECPARRESCARAAHRQAQSYSWERCARETLDFVAQFAA